MSVSGQMLSGKSSQDLGTLYNYNNDTAYFYLTNNDTRTVYFLPVQPGENYQVLCNTKTILPGEDIVIGLIYYTENKGKFQLEVPLYFSNSTDPVKLILTGNIRSVSPNALTVCPSIENSRPLNHTVPLNIIVRDRITDRQIKQATVKVEQGKRVVNCVPGFQSMAFQCNCQFGELHISATSEGYLPGVLDFDFAANNNTCIIYLDQFTEEFIIEKHEKETVKSVDTTVIKIIVYQPAEPQSFNATGYKPNHLIFVIDVSGSMKDSVKLGYLKTSISELIGILRPQDHMTLITYASKPQLIFENVNGLSKAKLYETIDSLHAKGGSVGSDALIMAYDLAHRHFIDGGNNQIFLATDGLFNGSSMDEKDIYRMAKREFEKNEVRLTTIAFGKNDKARTFLAELAAKGNGQGLAITNMPEDKKILIEEVKKQSLK